MNIGIFNFITEYAMPVFTMPFHCIMIPMLQRRIRETITADGI